MHTLKVQTQEASQLKACLSLKNNEGLELLEVAAFFSIKPVPIHFHLLCPLEW